MMSIVMDERSRQRQFEDQFLGQLRTRCLALTKGGLPADRVSFETMPDGIDAVRGELARLEVFDRGLLEQLPGTRTIQARFQKSLLGGLVKQTVARLRVQVLAPIGALVKGQTPGPVGREQVLDALARYELLPRRERPSAVALASASGFTAEARALVEAGSQPSVILLGGRADGGWDISMPASVRKSPWGKLFDLETQDDRLRRLMYHLEQNAELLDSRGLPVRELAEKLGLPQVEVEALIRKACRVQPRLMTVVQDGQTHVCRTPLAEEGSTSMGMWNRLRRWLGFKPTVAEQVREMTAQRVVIEQQRAELDKRTDALEAEERDVLARGAQAASGAEKKQLAGKLMRTRRDLGRLRAQANIYTQQIDILGTHIYHLTLAEQGKRLELPKAEDLTSTAAEAEQVVSELAANADLAANIEVVGQTARMADEEAAILAEFEQVAQKTGGEKAPEPAAPVAAPAPSAARGRTGEPAAAPPVPGSKSKESARPELG